MLHAIADWLEKWGTLLIAVVALAQPWALSLWKRLFPGNIEIHETGTIEIGYSGFGATVGLHGTLRVPSGSLFVREGTVQVTNLRDNSSHYFNCAVFRSFRGLLSQLNDMAVEIAAGFLVNSSQPHRFNIQFHDLSSNREVNAILATVRKGFTDLRGTFMQGKNNPAELQNVITEVTPEVYRQYSNSPAYTAAFAKLERMIYWQPGTYKLTGTFSTASPSRSFARSWYFTLSEADVESLHFNTIKILYDTCEQPFGQYFFAYPAYEHSLPQQRIGISTAAASRV